MPRVNGVYSLPPIYFAENGTTIMPQQHNAPLQDIAAALTMSLPRDGSAAMTGNLPMAGRKITGLADGTASQDAATFGQVPVLSAYVKSMSNLSMSADRVIYSLDGTTSAMAICTAYGRSLWGAANAGAARTLLGLGAAALGTTLPQEDWNTFTSTAEATISPFKLQTKLNNYRSISELGWDQTWQDVSASRSIGTSYQNDTGKPIEVSIAYGGATGVHNFQVSTNGSTWVTVCATQDSALIGRGSGIIPNNHYYRITGTGTLTGFVWSELRS